MSVTPEWRAGALYGWFKLNHRKAVEEHMRERGWRDFPDGEMRREGLSAFFMEGVHVPSGAHYFAVFVDHVGRCGR